MIFHTFEFNWMTEMKAEGKLARQKKAAREVAEIMYSSLQQFSEEEQGRRIKEIHKIALKASSKPSRKPSKHSSTRGTLAYPGLSQELGKCPRVPRFNCPQSVFS